MYLLDVMSGYDVFLNSLTNKCPYSEANDGGFAKPSVGQKPLKSILIWTLSTGGKLQV